MLTLGRNHRIKETILLPNHKHIHVNCDVDAKRLILLKGWNDTTLAAQTWVTDRANEEKRAAFYGRYAAFLQTVFGEKQWREVVDAYDGDAVEACMQLDTWVAESVVPQLKAASHREMERRRRDVRRAEKRRK